MGKWNDIPAEELSREGAEMPRPFPRLEAESSQICSPPNVAKNKGGGTRVSENERTKGRRSVTSGVEWEEKYGYCRAVRVGDRILVAGTTATGPEGLVGGDDPAAQARFCLDKIELAIQQLGGSLAEVVRTRVFVSNREHWEAIASVHGERFGAIRPANTLVCAQLIGDEYLVEIEAEAIVGSAADS